MLCKRHQNRCAQVAVIDFLTMQCSLDVKACLDILSLSSYFIFNKGNIVPSTIYAKHMEKRRASNSYYTKRYDVDN
jgi:hypothetical protein